MDLLLQHLWDSSGTDLLLTGGAPPLFRIDGQLRALDEAAPLDPDDVERLLAGLLSEKDLARFRDRGELDFAFGWERRARLRGNAFMQRGTPALALRMVPFDIPSFDDIGLPVAVRRLVDLPQGLILVTGPTGAGKSTTLAAIVDHVNRRRRCHILTVEDPIEYVHQHRGGAVNQREVGEDTESFDRALRSALREDPDVLMVGEMRDLESIEIVLTMAETGHLVLATLHTNDTSQALDRLIGVFPGDRQDQVRMQLSACLSAVVYQRLVPRIGGGLVAAYEVLVGTAAVRNLIHEGKTRQLRNVITVSQRDGMQTLEMSLSELVRAGTVSYQDAVDRSLYSKEVNRAADL